MSGHRSFNALKDFRGKLLAEEVKHQYYESLLNKVDTVVLVTDASGHIEWMNQAAVAHLGQNITTTGRTSGGFYQQ